MKIPEPNEYAANHGYNPFPPRWEKWLSVVRQGIISAQPQAGRHVTVHEHYGKGTVIDVERRPGVAPPACLASATVTFHGIAVDCGCMDGDLDTSFMLTDFNLDGRSVVEDLQPAAEGCGDCLWQFGSFDSPDPITADIWNIQPNTDCSGDPPLTVQREVDMSIMLEGGIYYAFGTVFSGLGVATVFIGSSADPTNIPNEAFCSSTVTDWQNPVTDCINGGLPFSYVGAGHNGYISVVLA